MTMSYSAKDTFVISVCLFTLTIAIVMYIVVCVYHVYMRRCCCKLRDKANADPVKLNSMKGVLGVRTHDITKDAKSSIYNTVVTDDCSASRLSIKKISQHPTGRQTFVIAKEGDIIDLSKRQTRRKSVQKKRLARKKEDDRIDLSKRHSRRVSGHQKTPACIREERKMDLVNQFKTRRLSERQKQVACYREEERKMDLVNQFKTRRLSEHQKQEACNREEEDINDLEQYYSERSNQMDLRYGEIKESKYTCRGSLDALITETRRFRSKDVTLPGLCNIADNQPVAIVWAPPPPPDPPNPN